jgi:stage III sporulation protein SpoIIIAA
MKRTKVTREAVLSNSVGYVRYLKGLPFVHTVFRCQNKAPLFSNWTAESEDEALLAEHLRNGGQLGVSLKTGWVIVDIDSEADAERLSEIYPFVFKTVRGCHLLFRQPLWANLKCETKVETASGFSVDYKVLRPNRKGVYIVAPCSEAGRDFAFMPKTEAEVPLLPLEFYLPKHQEFPVPEGKRNDTLFRILRQFRVFMKEHPEVTEDEVYEAGRHLNELLDVPLPDNELENLIRNALTLPDENGFEETLRMLESTTEGEKENPFLNVRALKDIVGGSRPYFWEGVCRRGDVVLLSGAPKSGKSTFVRSLALSTANETKWFGNIQQGVVLWYALEEYATDIRDMVAVASERYGLNADEIYIVEANPAESREPVKDFIEALRMHCQKLTPALVIVDTVGRLMTGVDINDYISVGRFIESIRFAIRDIPSQPVVFLVHHTNKALERTPLGSQAFQGSCDVLISLERKEDGATFSAVGRGTHPKYMEKIPLYFDMGVLRKEAVVPQGVAKLIRLIHTRKLNDAEQIMNYGKGAFRADIRRMFRMGLLYEDGDKIYTNSQHRLLERYLGEPEDEPEEAKTLFADVGEIAENVIEYPSETTAEQITAEEPEPEKDATTEGDDDMLLKQLKERGWCFLSEADPFLDDTFQKTEDHAFMATTPEETLEKLKKEGRELSLVEMLNRAYTAFKQPLRGELFDVDWKAPVAFVPTVVGGKTRWVVFYAPPHADLTPLLSKGRDAVRKNQPFFLEGIKEMVKTDDG